MCLFINRLHPKIADKDIVCYKLVKRTKIKGVYESIFQKFEYIIRQLYTKNRNIKFIDLPIHYRKYSEKEVYYIEEGMFHSYASNSYPIVLSRFPNYTLLKCIIPKGAYYFKGKYTNIPSYASSQIKILEEI